MGPGKPCVTGGTAWDLREGPASSDPHSSTVSHTSAGPSPPSSVCASALCCSCALWSSLTGGGSAAQLWPPCREQEGNQRGRNTDGPTH